MSGPTHRLADGTFVFPEGYELTDLTPLTNPYDPLANNVELLRSLLLAQVEDRREALEMTLLSPGGAKKLAYMHKAAEAKDYRTLSATTAGLIAAVTAMTTTQRRGRFPMIQAEAEASGDSFAVVVGRIETAVADGAWKQSRIEARAVGLKRKLKDATTVTQLRAIDVVNGWPT